jgi:hypothetical protein
MGDDELINKPTKLASSSVPFDSASDIHWYGSEAIITGEDSPHLCDVLTAVSPESDEMSRDFLGANDFVSCVTYLLFANLHLPPLGSMYTPSRLPPPSLVSRQLRAPDLYQQPASPLVSHYLALIFIFRLPNLVLHQDDHRVQAQEAASAS